MLARLRELGRLSRRAFLLAWHASPPMLLGVLVLLGVQAVLTPVQLALSGRVIDAAAAHLGGGAGAAVTADPRPGGSVWIWIALLAAAMASSQLIQPFSRTFQSLLGDRLVGHVTGEVIRATNRWQGLARFEDPSFADEVERAGVQAPRAGLDLVVYGARTVLLLWTAVALAVILAGLQVAAPILVILAAVPAVARAYEFRNNTGSKIYIHTPEARRMRYFRTVMTSPEPAKDVRLWGLGRFFRGRFDEAYDLTVRELSRTRWQLTTKMSLANALAAAAPGAVFVYVAWRISIGAGSLGDLVLYGGAAVALQVTLANIGFDIGFLPFVYAFLPSLARVLSAPPDLPVAADPCPAPRPVRSGIVFENVSFSYPGRDERVLDGLDLVLRPGESLALVGHNGSGKTTLVKLLLRLYDPTEGRILLDGRDLRDYDLTDLRRELGCPVPGLPALRAHRRREHRLRPGRAAVRPAPARGCGRTRRCERPARRATRRPGHPAGRAVRGPRTVGR